MTDLTDIDITNIIRAERAAEREIHEAEKKRLRTWLNTRIKAGSKREGGLRTLRLLKAMYTSAEQETADLRAENERLRAALEPFGRKANAESLSEALGHIGREDLLRAQELSK